MAQGGINVKYDTDLGEHRLWSRTLDLYTKTGLPGSAASRMSGPPPKTTPDRTKTNNTLSHKIEIKIPDTSRNRTRAAGLEGRDSYWPRHSDGQKMIVRINSNYEISRKVIERT